MSHPGHRAACVSLVLLCGFTCGPRPPGPVSFALPERWRREGKSLEAAVEYARIAGEAKPRSDPEGYSALAECYRWLLALNPAKLVAAQPEQRVRFLPVDPYLSDLTGRPFLALWLEAELHLLLVPSSVERRAEASSRLAEWFGKKADQPELRCTDLEDAALHRILLLEAAAAFEHRHLSLGRAVSRERLAAWIDRLRAEYDALAERPRRRPFALEQWKETAEALADLSVAVRRDAELPKLPEDFADLADWSVEEHLKKGTDWGDRANTEVTQRGDSRLAERWQRRALRHFVLVRELLASTSSQQEAPLARTLLMIKSWKALCFADR